ncbi:cytochrome b [Rhizobium alvei]|uniref:Cytochrome b/b6 domain-containing protein n=1 Tax=Rhizobium alvei TaxID=1132659 RepID=A0ABT8YNM2_9HYPH|nr:cytochrome b/b6 domain-containing protein [Rhizobium alvei]MDO6964899.1 cytochrome b/b6 domain-containing protein [Rhizobium alvei]
MAPLSYSIPQRIVHWLTVLLVFFNLLLPGQIERVADLLGGGKVPTPEEWSSANLHIYSGFAILALTVIRLILRAVQGAPAAPADEPAIFKLIAKAVHGLIYLLLFTMPLSGIAKFYFHVDVAGFVHGGPMKLLLWIMLVAHIGAALVHKFYWKTDVMDRMTKGV